MSQKPLNPIPPASNPQSSPAIDTGKRVSGICRNHWTWGKYTRLYLPEAAHRARRRTRRLGSGNGRAARVCWKKIWCLISWNASGNCVESRLAAEVILHRKDDSYLALEKRAEIANLAQANLFVSVHANYSDYPSARGVETYYTNTYASVKARTEEADDAAAPPD